MRTLSQVILLCSLVSIYADSAGVQKAKVKITGTYTNMHYIEDAGDVVGMEVFVMWADEGYYATVQVAEGVPSSPKLVKATIKGSRIEFTIHPYGRYQGTIFAKGLSGKFDSEQKARFLQRKKSYWQ